RMGHAKILVQRDQGRRGEVRAAGERPGADQAEWQLGTIGVSHSRSWIGNERERSHNEIKMNSLKEEVTALLERLPDDSTIEDVQYQLYVLENVRNGLDAAKTEGTLTQREAEERLGKWLVW